MLVIGYALHYCSLRFNKISCKPVSVGRRFSFRKFMASNIIPLFFDLCPIKYFGIANFGIANFGIANG